jgi:type VI secretion system protein ImpF
MSPKALDSRLRLSLLDRLIDLTPDSRKELPLSPWEEEREVKASLCRDLTALLNTRRAERDFSGEFEEAENSVLTFGIVDFTSYNLKGAADQERVRRSIERAIRQFEPRLTRVVVSLDPIDVLKPVLRFQISAVLREDATGEPLLFDVTLHRDSRRIGVSGALS